MSEPHSPPLRTPRMSSSPLLLEVKHKDSVLEPSIFASSGDKKKSYGTLVTLWSGLVRNHRSALDRTISKDGQVNLIVANVGSYGIKKFLDDGFTSVLELSWGWTLVLFSLTFVLSWIFFALLWYAIAYSHGDLANVNDPIWEACVSNIDGFVTALLYSIETQQTIGFGYYHLGSRCPEAVTLLSVQAIAGVILEGLLVGIVFVKLTRATKRSATIIFSKNALVNMRDGALYLVIRLGDMRTKSLLLGANVRAQYVSKKTTREGEVINHHQQELEISADGEKDSRVLLFWPTLVLHKIDSSSPLFNLSPTDLHADNKTFEIIVVLEGINASTGMITQARTSYLPGEILWGQRFEDLQASKTDAGTRELDFSRFHNTYAVETPFASSAEISQLKSSDSSLA